MVVIVTHQSPSIQIPTGSRCPQLSQLTFNQPQTVGSFSTLITLNSIGSFDLSSSQPILTAMFSCVINSSMLVLFFNVIATVNNY